MKNNNHHINLRFSIDVPVTQKKLAIQIGDNNISFYNVHSFHFDNIGELEDLLDKLIDLRDDFYYEYL